MFVKVLPPEVRSKIAAGEVVEFPVDVIKELVENSLDAKATQISVEISKGGKRYIRVVDNGTGIHPDDIEKVILPGATSKISSEKDLYSINSYGFRGEALYAISAVSHLKIRSRYFQKDAGMELYASGGEIKHKKTIGLPVGTSVEVTNLFFNLPVRQKFLRKSDTEKRKIKRLILDYALTNPGVGFTFTSEGRKSLHLKPESPEERVEALFGTGFELIEAEKEQLRIKAFLRRNEIRSEIRVFINSRPVFNRSLKDFLRRVLGYKTLAVVFVEMPPFLLEQNVHPKKHEVRIIKEKKFFEILREALTGKSTTFADISFLSQEEPPYGESIEVVGQLMDTLIVARIGDFLYFFDQHLLSERLNYESLGEKRADVACKSALKKGETLSKSQMLELVQSWLNFNNPHVCPHGRPIYYKVHLKEILSKVDRSF